MRNLGVLLLSHLASVMFCQSQVSGGDIANDQNTLNGHRDDLADQQHRHRRRSLGEAYAPESDWHDRQGHFVTVPTEFHEPHFCGTHHPSHEALEKEAAELRTLVNNHLENRGGRRLCVKCIEVETAFHVIYADGTGLVANLSESQIDRQMQKLNDDYQETPFWFSLVDVTRTNSSDWFYLDGPRFQNDIASMQSELGQVLRQGDRRTLNIYSLTMRSRGLGMTVFPSSFAGSKDGVFVDHCSVPDGDGCTEFSTGDILTHEIGHWLGLLHTFEGGCNEEYGDYVSDTPPQAGPIYECPESDIPVDDSCPDSPGRDPINNTMGYGIDCYEGFTEGQKIRMYEQWMLYREGTQVCRHNEGILTVELGLDDVPESNHWRLFHTNNQMISMAQFGKTEEGMKQVFDLCLPYGASMYFGFGDDEGNGLARNSTYRVKFDGKLLRDDATFEEWAGVGFTMIDPSGCSSDEMQLVVELLLDHAPEETHWRIQGFDGRLAYVEPEYSLRGSPKFYAGASIRREICLSRTEEYYLVLEDSGGNGFNSTRHGITPFFQMSIDGQPIVYKKRIAKTFDMLFDVFGEVHPRMPSSSVSPSALSSTRPSASSGPVPTTSTSPSETPTALLFPTLVPTVVKSSHPSQSALPSVASSESGDISISVGPSHAPSYSGEPSLGVTPSIAPSHSGEPSISSAPSIPPSKTGESSISAIPSIVSSIGGERSINAVPNMVPSDSGEPSISLAPSIVPSDSGEPSISAAPSFVPSNSGEPSISAAPSFVLTNSGEPSISSAPSVSSFQVPKISSSLSPSAVPTLIPTTTESTTPSFSSAHTTSAPSKSLPAVIQSSSPMVAQTGPPTSSQIPQGPSITGFTLIDSLTNADISPLTDDSTIYLDETPHISIRVETDGPVGSVVFAVNGTLFQREYRAPYAIAGDYPVGNYTEWKPPTGAHTLTATIYDATEVLQYTLSITLNIREDHSSNPLTMKLMPTMPPTPESPSITGFTLVNATSNSPIGPLKSGDTIDVDQGPMNVRADTTDPAQIGSVQFLLNGKATNVENFVPYALAGDIEGDYNMWDSPSVGMYTVKAVIFSSADGRGAEGASLEVSLRIVHGSESGRRLRN